jgi:hypothetical protein
LLVTEDVAPEVSPARCSCQRMGYATGPAGTFQISHLRLTTSRYTIVKTSGLVNIVSWTRRRLAISAGYQTSLAAMMSRSPASDWTRNHGVRNICAARKATQWRRSVSLNGTISKSFRYGASASPSIKPKCRSSACGQSRNRVTAVAVENPTGLNANPDSPWLRPKYTNQFEEAAGAAAFTKSANVPMPPWPPTIV